MQDVNKSRDLLTPLFVHELVEQIALRYPNHPAVVLGGDSITYRQLINRADALAQAIRKADPEARWIGISTTRSIATIVGVLAILKAGKAYLPLDPAYPETRLQQISTDAGLQTVLTTARDESLFSGLGMKVLLAENEYSPTQEPVNEPDTSIPGSSIPGTSIPGSTAYVLYTSGSTGRPKGVCMGHNPLVNLLYWQQKQSKADVGTRTLQLAPLSFDVSFQEIFATLGTGGTLMLINESQRLDLNALLRFIDAQAVNRLFLPFVALQYLAEAAVSASLFPAHLTEVMTAGEQLKITPQLVQFFTALPNCVLFNQYGPTECHVITQLALRDNPANWPALPGIGFPIDNVQVFVLDDALNLLPDGETGELCFGGACLAEGYLNQPDLTAEKFIVITTPQSGPMRVYRTGDIGRLLPDGSIEFLGRRDDQVKIRGHRVELGEVEVVIGNLPGIKQAVVTARERADGQKQLVAYLVAANAHTNQSAIRAQLESQLPEYMMPSAFVWLDELPKTSSGKVDRKQLPEPAHTRPELNAAYRKPRTELEKTIASSWEILLQLNKVGVDDNFFELGGNSLLAQKTVALLRQQSQTLPVTKLYQFPTVAGVAAFLQPETTKKNSPQKREWLANKPEGERPEMADHDVAIIGMAGRFPGASTIEALWELLKEGRETTRFFTDDELDPSLPDALKNDPLYVKARGVIDGPDQFDAHFFGLSPNVARLMDPQQRVFLEIAWETLEQTGHLPQYYAGSVGVFAGCGNNTYYQKNIPGHTDLIEQVGAFQVMTLNEKDYIASRTAYQLNLTGPAVSVYAACSTSLLAITQAVQSIRSGQCDVALAGGASITTPINSGHLYQEGAMLSRDGHCRSFDADAQGTVFSDGAGVVLLKSRRAAERNGDTIYAVIKGVGVNNDGGGKGSFTAPNAMGQAGAITMAIADARIDPSTISYVEAHGTATPLGDPIEIEGLTQAFGEQTQTQFCAIGSIKSNMGHLTQAAGVAGLIKTVLALHHGQLPPSINFRTPNPVIDFSSSPFYVNTKLTDWKTETTRRANPRRANPRRAGVSSFGVGGTNVHVVLEEFENVVPESDAGRQVQLLTWSAKTTDSATAYGLKLADFMSQADAPALADAAYTLQTTRPDFAHRRFAVAGSPDELAQKLRTDSQKTTVTPPVGEPGEVVFLFPGQGAQFLNMGRGLYENEAVFRQAVNTCAELLKLHMDADIRAVIYPETADSEAEQRLKNTRYTQPALFVTEYALAQLWMSWGIVPTIFCGHSIGEFVAAHLSGVFSLSDALTLIATRGRLVSELPHGSMLSVRMAADEVLPLLPDTLSMAAVNSHKLCVVAGPDGAIADFARLLDERGIANQPLQTSHAFHSAMMDPIVGQFEDVVSGVALNRPQKPVVSTVSGMWLTDAQATDPHYWAGHLRNTVRFSEALDTLFTLDNPLLLEVGPGHVTATLARQQAGRKPVSIFPGIPSLPDWTAACGAVLTTLGQLFQNGLNPDWSAFYAGQRRNRVNLPTYAFARKRCWLDPVPIGPQTVPNQTVLVNQAVFVDSSAQHTPEISAVNPPKPMRKDTLVSRINQLLEDASGIDMAGVDPEASFLEIGLDSLLLTQVALTLKREFGFPITFRQLTADYTSPALLASYLDTQLPSEAHQPTLIAAPVALPVAPLVQVGTVGAANPVLDLISQQVQLLARQIELLQTGQSGASVPASPATNGTLSVHGNGVRNGVLPNGHLANGTTKTHQNGHVITDAADLTPEEKVELKKPFGATARIERQASELSDKLQHFLEQLTGQYNQKTAKSKAYAQEHRAHMADPRVVSGFRPATKELVYPLVVNHSKGSRLWDIDGNEYIDALNGFGSNMFGYQPDWIKTALHNQIEAGFEVGPQHELAGEVSQLICELTGSDRAALCNTGSEAVLGAMRVARTVTGRSLIVAFSGSYHGIADEVLVRGTKKLKSFPAAPGIMPESVQNMLILDYGTDESLRIIRERAHELAAVLVEPVQSRRPEFVPVEFLKQVRTITEEAGTALIFDEVITGFRTHPGGTQALFGIRADLGTYGKVVGAGLPIGVIAGKREFMDALDGGFWQYGDTSVPEIGVTYFAGTFVRHPMALAAAKAALLHMKEAGPQLQQQLTQKTTRLANAMNTVLLHGQLPLSVVHFGSLWKIKPKEDIQYGELLFTLMRHKGIHIWDGFPCFLTEAHTEGDIDTIIGRFSESINELITAGIFAGETTNQQQTGLVNAVTNNPIPPVPGAKIGRDETGNPAWFVLNPDLPGQYLMVDLI